MKPYSVGHRRPPRHTQFKKGVCANPRGRGKAKGNEQSASVSRVLSELVEYNEGGKRKKAPLLKILILRLFNGAMRGDVRSANDLLLLRAHAQRRGEPGPLIIRVLNDPELSPGEAREEWLPVRTER